MFVFGRTRPHGHCETDLNSMRFLGQHRMQHPVQVARTASLYLHKFAKTSCHRRCKALFHKCVVLKCGDRFCRACAASMQDCILCGADVEDPSPDPQVDGMLPAYRMHAYLSRKGQVTSSMAMSHLNVLLLSNAFLWCSINRTRRVSLCNLEIRCGSAC